MQSFFALALVTVIWVLVGYTLAFGPDKFGLIGGLKWLGLNGVGQLPVEAYAAALAAGGDAIWARSRKTSYFG